ncbi:MAG: acyl-CoA dehydrogenase FadE [Plesiomonas sp.]
MALLLTFVFFIGIFGLLAYHRIKLYQSALILVGFALLTVPLQLISLWVWLPVLLVIGSINIAPLRRRMFSLPALKAFQRIMPSMSKTEQEALEAGTTWWEGELFRGKPDWSVLHAYPIPTLSDEEQAFLDGPVNTLCQMTNDFQITHELADLPPEIWQYLKDQRFFAMIIQKQYGGLEFSAHAQSLVLQKLAGVSSVLASTVGVPNSLGPGELLQHYGTPAQKEHYLPRLACGEEIPCFALTSPEAGSDAGAIPDTGIICRGTWQGEEILGMRLTWNKRYITLAPVATVLGLAFKLYDPEHLLGITEDLGITCALIPTDTDGVQIGRRHFPLNIPFQNGPTQGQDVFVPLDYIIGGQTMAGQGWRMLMECLSVGRGITLPSNTTGGTKSAALATGAYARIRRQFKMPIGYMEGIEEPLARIAAHTYLLDAAATLTTTAIDLGEKPAVISAIVKYHCTHRAQRCVIDAMDIVGGKGICMGPNNFLARAYQGAPIAITVEGANILTRSMIIYGQGAIRCHPYVLAEMNAAKSSGSLAVKQFDDALFGHLGFALSNTARTLWLGVTDGRTSAAPKQARTLTRYYQRLNRLSANLALLSDISMGVLGGNLKRRERLSARLGDLLSYLFLSSAALKRFADDGSPEADLPLLEWSLQDNLYLAQHAIDEILQNFPQPAIAKVLRFFLLPLGKTYRRPNDQLDHQLARILQTPSATRSRLGRNQFLQNCPHNPAGRLEQALEDVLLAETILNRLRQTTGENYPLMALDKLAENALQAGTITTHEAELLHRAEQGRLYAINVDDFAPHTLAAYHANKRVKPALAAVAHTEEAVS